MADYLVIQARPELLLGQPIVRAMPAAKCRSVGPFVFFDHISEHHFAQGSGVDIGQHPHIGLSTLSYLFEGQLQHKDSLGSDQIVQAGDVSWMTAGHAIAHVERTPQALFQSGSKVHGTQLWVALPAEEEECEPSYSHHPKATLPRSSSMGVEICVIAGSGFCMESPVPMRSPALYAELKMAAGTVLQIPDEYSERALYLVKGEVLVDDTALPELGLMQLPQGEVCTISACSESHLLLIGGEPIGPRRMYWNFVASRPELIEQARQRWSAGDWPTVPGETTRIEYS
jgi:redox-sensitive bicupin YhaK (pirin superfamily)